MGVDLGDFSYRCGLFNLSPCLHEEKVSGFENVSRFTHAAVCSEHHSWIQLFKCRKHSPAALVLYISLVFSNVRRVLSQYNTRLGLLYLLIKSLSTTFRRLA